MKVSLNLAQYYSNVDLKSIPRDELLRRIGAQLGAVESVEDWVLKYEGIVVVKVVSCEKHPNADKLNVCRVDDDGATQNIERDKDGLVQVVCGAPNVREGLTVAWIPPGAVVPSTREKDPFTLEVRELRGVNSNGMLASPAELGISDNHDGILEIEEGVQAGTPFSQLYGLDDLVIDCENKMFTHRPDCFGNLGVAREIAGIFGLKFEDPEWYWKKPEFTVPGFKFANPTLKLEIRNETPELVPRFMAVAMSGVTVAPSPIWLQASLTRVGIKPINNVVDVTNYIMHLTGQPLHAFDYDKIVERSSTPGIFPRLSRKGEKLMLLGGKEVELAGEEIVISTDKQAVGLAGVMGGAETEVDENTKNIIVECATFDMYSIRRTSMRHGLFTDAVTRFNKGQSPLQNDRVIAFAIDKMAELTGATQASDVYDLRSGIDTAYWDQSISGSLTTTVEFINDRLGSGLSETEICGLLQNVHFAAYTNDDGLLEITAPFWRTDIEIPEDIVEEVGRLYGYDKLPVSLPPRSAKPTPRNSLNDYKMHLRYALKEAGANEVLTYSFVHGDLLKSTGTDPEEWAYHLRNAISPDLQYYRTSLMPSLLAKVQPNTKAQAGRDDNVFALFEIGKAHLKNDVEAESGLPKELERLALVFAADGKAAKSYGGSPYFQAKKYLELLTEGQAQFVPAENFKHPLTSVYLPGRAAFVLLAGEPVGIVGEFSTLARKALKLPSFCAGFEVDIDKLQTHLKPRSYKPLSTFPSTNQDMTLEADEKTTWEHVEQLVHAELAVSAAEVGCAYELTPLSIFRADGADQVRFSFRIELTPHDRTLTTNEVNTLLDQLSARAKDDLNAVRI